MKIQRMSAVLLFVTLLGAGLAMAQTASFKTKAVDAEGKPMVGATVEMAAIETGRKYTLKTDAKGVAQSVGIVPDSYNIRLLRGGQVVETVTNFPITFGAENYLEFDERKVKAQQAQQMTAEQRAAHEAAVKETEKVSGLNSMIRATNEAVQAKKYEDAVQIMRQATATGSSYDLLWGKLCEVDVFAGRSVASSDRAKAQDYYQDAAQACDKAIAIKPTAAYYANRADANARLGKLDAATQDYDQAAKLDPPNAARHYFNQGAVLTNANRADEANAAFDRAIAADPKYADAYYQKAINLMSKATVDPKTNTMTAPPEVARNLNKYLELAPDGPNAATAKQLIESLGAKVETTFGKQGTRKR
jgi:tetratricopeptide (TPR) repeat protein